MLNRDIVVMLRNEAKTKPVIANLVNRIDELSRADIDTSSVPLPWYRKALHELKNRNELASRMDAAEHYVDQMGGFTEVSHVGDIYVYGGPDFETKPISGLSISIRTGDLLFNDDTGLWLGTMLVPDDLIAQSKLRDAGVSRKQYSESL